MCTIVVAHRIHPELPLIVAANRDEFYARAATAPQLLGRDPRAAGGLDLSSGGTWMGATERGFFVAITNQRTYLGSEPGLPSRGAIVREALERGSRAGVRALLGAIDARGFNPFNLVYGDADGVEVAYARRDDAVVDIEQAPDGMWVLPNDRIGSPEFPKVARVQALLEGAFAAPWLELRRALVTALGDHEKPALAALPALPEGTPMSAELVRELHATCIHTESYGTRSSTLLGLTRGGIAHYEFADGPPCRTPFDDVTSLLR
ncbi:MAG TPA: NRDE family protein [Kofleriaceae bacterium]|nr:NRDE family protein [Kofleriaceae bacterium]